MSPLANASAAGAAFTSLLFAPIPFFLDHVDILLSMSLLLYIYTIIRGRQVLRPLVLYLVACGLFAQVRAYADQAGLPVQFDYVISAEQALFGSVPSAWLQEQLYQPGHAGLIELFSTATYASFFIVFQAVALMIWVRKRQEFGLYAGAVLLLLYAGLLTSLVLPTAPPWLAAFDGKIPPVHRVVQELFGQQAYSHGATVAGVNEVAAMPSLHMGMTVLLALVGWRYARWAGVLGLVYVASMSFSLVYLGEHYVMDELAGAVLALGCWRLALHFWVPAASQVPSVLSYAAVSIEETPRSSAA